MSNEILLFASSALPVDLDTIIGGGAGAALMAALIYTVKLVLDRTVPSRSDSRASVSLVLEGLTNMVKVLQEEKLSDAKRLADRQSRIDSLEGEADKDYERIKDFRNEVIDLTTRLSTKDRHINILITELNKLGAQVTGMDIDILTVQHTTITAR